MIGEVPAYAICPASHLARRKRGHPGQAGPFFGSRKFFLFVPTRSRFVLRPKDFQLLIGERVSRRLAFPHVLLALGLQRRFRLLLGQFLSTHGRLWEIPFRYPSGFASKLDRKCFLLYQTS